MIPATAASPEWADHRALADRQFKPADVLAVLVESLDPVDRIDMLPGVDVFSSGSIQHPGEAALLRMYQQLLLLSIAFNIDQNLLIRRIEIVSVVRDLLVVPFQFAGIGVERDYRVGIKIVAFAVVAMKIG